MQQAYVQHCAAHRSHSSAAAEGEVACAGRTEIVLVDDKSSYHSKFDFRREKRTAVLSPVYNNFVAQWLFIGSELASESIT